MTIRQLLTEAIRFTEDLDQDIKVRIITRNEHGAMTSVKVVPIATYFSLRGMVCVEQEAIDRVTPVSN